MKIKRLKFYYYVMKKEPKTFTIGISLINFNFLFAKINRLYHNLNCATSNGGIIGFKADACRTICSTVQSASSVRSGTFAKALKD